MNAFLPPDAAAYLEALRGARGAPPGAGRAAAEERDELLGDVESSLLAAAADGEEQPTARLGPPERFAAELRAAAGLQPPGGLAAVRRALEAPAARELRRLAPVWWVARGYVLVAALVLAVGGAWSLSHPSIPHVFDGRGGIAAIVAAAVASVALGLGGSSSREGRRALAAANLVLVAAAIPVLRHVWRSTPAAQPQIVEVVSEPVGGLASDGTPVRNIYPYSRDGRLLHDVLLYDENGTPLAIGGPNAPDPNRRLLVTARGNLLFNSFPIRYFEPGTRRVAHPNAGPRVRTPALLTPPLRLRPSSPRAQARAARAKRSRASGTRSRGAPRRSSG
jgi:hypothetical protein